MHDTPTIRAQVAVVLGTQWGDEGKGKLVDILAGQYEVVARAQVGFMGERHWRSRSCSFPALHSDFHGNEL